MRVIYKKPNKNEKGRYVFHNPLESKSPFDVEPRYEVAEKERTSYFDFGQMFSKADLYDECIRMKSMDKARKLQEKVLKITDDCVDFLKKYELPQKINGEALVRFRMFPVKKKSLFFPLEIGEIGFPDFSIQTDLGYSGLCTRPQYYFPRCHIIYDRHKSHSDYISLEVFGAGIVDEMLAKIFPNETFQNISSVIYRPHRHSSHGMSGELKIPI